MAYSLRRSKRAREDINVNTPSLAPFLTEREAFVQYQPKSSINVDGAINLLTAEVEKLKSDVSSLSSGESSTGSSGSSTDLAEVYASLNDLSTRTTKLETSASTPSGESAKIVALETKTQDFRWEANFGDPLNLGLTYFNKALRADWLLSKRCLSRAYGIIPETGDYIDIPLIHLQGAKSNIQSQIDTLWEGTTGSQLTLVEEIVKLEEKTKMFSITQFNNADMLNISGQVYIPQTLIGPSLDIGHMFLQTLSHNDAVEQKTTAILLPHLTGTTSNIQSQITALANQVTGSFFTKDSAGVVKTEKLEATSEFKVHGFTFGSTTYFPDTIKLPASFIPSLPERTVNFSYLTGLQEDIAPVISVAKRFVWDSVNSMMTVPKFNATTELKTPKGEITTLTTATGTISSLESTTGSIGTLNTSTLSLIEAGPTTTEIKLSFLKGLTANVQSALNTINSRFTYSDTYHYLTIPNLITTYHSSDHSTLKELTCVTLKYKKNVLDVTGVDIPLQYLSGLTANVQSAIQELKTAIGPNPIRDANGDTTDSSALGQITSLDTRLDTAEGTIRSLQSASAGSPFTNEQATKLNNIGNILRTTWTSVPTLVTNTWLMVAHLNFANRGIYLINVALCFSVIPDNSTSVGALWVATSSPRIGQTYPDEEPRFAMQNYNGASFGKGQKFIVTLSHYFVVHETEGALNLWCQPYFGSAKRLLIDTNYSRFEAIQLTSSDAINIHGTVTPGVYY